MADDADNAEIKFTPQEHFEFWKKSWRATRLIPEFVPNHFEYHPSVLHQHLLCFGTAHGQVSLFNHETNTVCFTDKTLCTNKGDTLTGLDKISGLCWFNRSPNRFIAASDNSGRMCVYSFDDVPKPSRSKHGAAAAATAYRRVNYKARLFPFASPKLTSTHINCTDDRFVISDSGRDVNLFDLSTGMLRRKLRLAHEKKVTTARFAHHCPHLLATCSSDKTVKMWDLRDQSSRPIYTKSSESRITMLRFSPNDLYMLTSAADRDIRQRHVLDGRDLFRLETKICSKSVASHMHGYYMNQGKVIVQGSSGVRLLSLYSASTGLKITDVDMYPEKHHHSLWVQTLRAHPHEDWKFTALVNYKEAHAGSEMVYVNMQSEMVYAPDNSASPPVASSASAAAATPSVVAHPEPSYRVRPIDLLHQTDSIFDNYTRVMLDHKFIDLIMWPSDPSPEKIRCHKHIISCRCPALASLIKRVKPDDAAVEEEEDGKATAKYELHMPPGCDDLSCKCLLVYLYTDQTRYLGTLELIGAAIRMARLLRLPRLQQLCVARAGNMLRPEAIVDTLRFAIEFGCDDLKHLVLTFGMRNMRRIRLNHQQTQYTSKTPDSDRKMLAMLEEHIENSCEISSLDPGRSAGGAAAPPYQHKAKGAPASSSKGKRRTVSDCYKLLPNAMSHHLGVVGTDSKVMIIGGSTNADHLFLHSLWTLNVRNFTWTRSDVNGPNLESATCAVSCTPLEVPSNKMRYKPKNCRRHFALLAPSADNRTLILLDSRRMIWKKPTRLKGSMTIEDATSGRIRHTLNHARSVQTSPGRLIGLKHYIVLFAGLNTETKVIFNDVQVVCIQADSPDAYSTKEHVKGRPDTNKLPMPAPHGFSFGFVYQSESAAIRSSPELKIDRFTAAPSPRFGHTTTTCGNRMVVFGGISIADGLYNDIHCLNVDNPTTPFWEKFRVSGRPAEPIYGHYTTLSPISARDNKFVMMIFGGMLGGTSKCTNRLSMLEVRVPGKVINNVQMRWSTPVVEGTLPPVRAFHCSAVVGSRIIVFGGSELGHMRNVHEIPMDRNIHVLKPTAKVGVWRWSQPQMRVCICPPHPLIVVQQSRFARQMDQIGPNMTREFADVAFRVAKDPNNGALNDTTLVYTSRSLLSHRSEVFSFLMCNGGMRESHVSGEISEVFLPGVSASTLRLLLQYLVSGRVVWPTCGDKASAAERAAHASKLVQLLQAADFWQLACLVRQCEGHLVQSCLTRKTCCELLSLAETLHLVYLKMSTTQMALRHWKHIKTSPELAALPEILREWLCTVAEFASVGPAGSMIHRNGFCEFETST